MQDLAARVKFRFFVDLCTRKPFLLTTVPHELNLWQLLWDKENVQNVTQISIGSEEPGAIKVMTARRTRPVLELWIVCMNYKRLNYVKNMEIILVSENLFDSRNFESSALMTILEGNGTFWWWIVNILSVVYEIEVWWSSFMMKTGRLDDWIFIIWKFMLM